MKVQIADVTFNFREVELPETCPHCTFPVNTPEVTDGEASDPIVGVLSGLTYRATLEPIREIPTVYRAIVGKVDDDMEIHTYGKHVPVLYTCGECDLPLVEGKYNDAR